MDDYNDEVALVLGNPYFPFPIHKKTVTQIEYRTEKVNFILYRKGIPPQP